MQKKSNSKLQIAQHQLHLQALPRPTAWTLNCWVGHPDTYSTWLYQIIVFDTLLDCHCSIGTVVADLGAAAVTAVVVTVVVLVLVPV